MNHAWQALCSEISPLLAVRQVAIRIHLTFPFILLPGGVAQIIKNSDKPIHELSIAIAGPLVNVVIAGVLVVPLGLRLGPMPLTSHGLLPAGLANTPSLNPLLIWLFSANASRVLFSLIPAFPPGLLILRSAGQRRARATVRDKVAQIAALEAGFAALIRAAWQGLLPGRVTPHQTCSTTRGPAPFGATRLDPSWQRCARRPAPGSCGGQGLAHTIGA